MAGGRNIAYNLGQSFRGATRLGIVAVIVGLTIVVGGAITYYSCLLEVPAKHQAVLISKTGLELEPGMEIAPPRQPNEPLYKGIQAEVIKEGRYFFNPIYWEWEIKEQFEVPQGKLGVRVALSGDDLPLDQILAEDGQKGVIREVLRPGRYAYNWYAEEIKLFDPVTIPAGFRGVVTNLAGPLAKDPNQETVAENERGVQPNTLTAGTYYFNPYEKRVSLVDCRSQRYDISQGEPLDFLSADGFPVVIDGNIEFRVMEKDVARLFVLYNEIMNGDEIKEEIIGKIITPESRSICRINGSKLSGSAFIGKEREQFERDFETSLKDNCKKQGIEIVAVTINDIKPPEGIRELVRQRERAKQQLTQYQQEKLQQESEAQLRVQEMLGNQKEKLVQADQGVIQETTKAEQDQKVAVTKAEQELSVTKTQLEAAVDKAASIVSEAEAAAAVIRFQNAADVAGITTRMNAFQGNGAALSQNMLIEKIAPAFRAIISNTDGPIMELFQQMTNPNVSLATASYSSGTTAPATTTTPAAAKPAMSEKADVTPPAESAPGATPKPAATPTPTPTPNVKPIGADAKDAAATAAKPAADKPAATPPATPPTPPPTESKPQPKPEPTPKAAENDKDKDKDKEKSTTPDPGKKPETAPKTEAKGAAESNKTKGGTDVENQK